MFKLKDPYRESWDIRSCSFGPNWNQIAGFSLLGQGIRKSPALAKYLLILSPTTRKNPPFVDSPTKCLSPSTKRQFPCFNPVKKIIFSFLATVYCCCTIFILTLSFLYIQVMLILISVNVQCLQNAVFSFEKGSNSQDHSPSDSHNPIKNLFYSKIFNSLTWENFHLPLNTIW